MKITKSPASGKRADYFNRIDEVMDCINEKIKLLNDEKQMLKDKADLIAGKILTLKPDLVPLAEVKAEICLADSIKFEGTRKIATQEAYKRADKLLRV